MRRRFAGMLATAIQRSLTQTRDQTPWPATTARYVQTRFLRRNRNGVLQNSREALAVGAALLRDTIPLQATPLRQPDSCRARTQKPRSATDGPLRHLPWRGKTLVQPMSLRPRPANKPVSRAGPCQTAPFGWAHPQRLPQTQRREYLRHKPLRLTAPCPPGGRASPSCGAWTRCDHGAPGIPRAELTGC